MKAGPIILGILSLLAAAIGYAVTFAILSAMSLPDGLAGLGRDLEVSAVDSTLAVEMTYLIRRINELQSASFRRTV